MSENLIHQVIRSKRRTLTLEINSNAQLIIRAPLRISMDTINQIIEKKRSWILTKQQKAKDKYQPVTAHHFIEGEDFLYLGVSYKLRFVVDWQRPFEFNGSEFLIGQQFSRHAKRFFETWYMNQAKELITSRVEIYAQRAQRTYSRINITDAKTRWGSCNSKKTLNFNWRLIMAPLDKIDYVVAHEVAHLQELNHSSRFWSKVEALIPDYKIRQQWFKDNQSILHTLNF